MSERLMQPNRRYRNFAVATIAALSVGGCTTSETEKTVDPIPKTTIEDYRLSDNSVQKARKTLAQLAIKGRAPKTGYEREQFSSGWATIDGCDVRNTILQRDLTQEILKSDNCTVLMGTLQDPYTAEQIDFHRGIGTSDDVQIDHVVALSDAWQKGAQQLDVSERAKFANDPLNLLAVDGPTNSSKGDGDAATWLPPNKSYRCSYVARQVEVKDRYELWVTSAEHQAIVRVLTSCSN